MNDVSLRSTKRVGRLFGSLILGAVLGVGLSACSGDAVSDDAASDSTVAPDSKRASKAIEEGLAEHANGDLTAAADLYNTALTYEPSNKYAFYNLALIDESNGNYGLAEENYRSALDADPNYEPALFNLAILRTARNDATEAIALYKRAVAVDKKDAAAWLNLGLLLRNSGQEKAGNEAVLRAIGLDATLEDPDAPVEGEGPASP